MAPPRPRQVIDYALARRAVLADLFAGRATTTDVCDAHPYLIKAARYHGMPSDVRCPVCKHRDPLLNVYYAYGEVLGPASGRPRRARELDSFADLPGEVRTYLVEVCPYCGWNHLVTSSVLGGCAPVTPRRRGARSGASADADARGSAGVSSGGSAVESAAGSRTGSTRRGRSDGQAAGR